MADVIRELLVDLGFRVDNASLTRFTSGLSDVTKSVGTLGEGILGLGEKVAGLAVAGAVAIEKFSANLEQLYFSSKRVGSTASELRAFDQAARNFGTTAGEMQGAVEGLAQALNTNPGNVGLLSGLLGRVGAHVSGDNVTNMANLAKVFQGMPMWQALQFAQQFGIDYNDVFAMRQPGFNAEALRQQGLNRGLNQPAADSHRTQMAYRNAETETMTTATGVADALMRKVAIPLLDKFNAWLGSHQHAIVGGITSALDTVSHFVTKTLLPDLSALDTKLKGLVGEFDKLNQKSGGRLGTASEIIGGMAATGTLTPALITGWFGLKGIMKLSGWLGRLLLGGGGEAAAGAEAGGGALAAAGAAALPVAIGAAVLGALGFGGYEVDKHWQSIKGFGGRAWGDITHPSWLVGIAPHTAYDNPNAVGNGGGTTINNNQVIANITVDGSQSPADTGKAVADAVQRIQRNAATVVQ